MRSLLLAATAALALAACQKSEPANVAGDGNVAFDANATVEDNLTDESATDVAVETESVPAPAAGATAVQAAPLTTAKATEQAIERGTGIRRVRHGDGWAWYEGDRIVRTASADGRRVAYFRPGEDQPYLVHEGSDWFGYRNGQPQQRYGHDGKPDRPSAEELRRAQAAAQQARDAHRAPDRDDHSTMPDRRNDGDRMPSGSNHDARSPLADGRDARTSDDRHRPQPTPTPSTRQDNHHDRGTSRDDRQPYPRPTATPDTDRAQQDHRH